MLGSSGFAVLREREESEDGQPLPNGKLSSDTTATDAASDSDGDNEADAQSEEDLPDTCAASGRRVVRLEGNALSLYRQERGVSLESLAKGSLALAEASSPVLHFDDLCSRGVDVRVARAAQRCAGGHSATTAVQAECWGQLLKLRDGGAFPDVPVESQLRCWAKTASQQLNEALSVPLPKARPEEDWEPNMPFDPSCSRCEVREGRDLVGIAPTGSGKTLAYLLPLLADGLCKVQCSAAPSVDSIFERFQALYPRSFEAGRGSNDTILNRLCKVYAEKRNEEVMKAMTQVAKKAAAGSKDEALRDAWSRVLEEIDSEGRLRPAGLVLVPSRELAQQVGQVAKDLGCSCKVILGGVDHLRQREQLKVERPALLVATPGRLRALCGQWPASATARAASDGREDTLTPPEALISLRVVLRLVLDEGDRLIDEGFEEDIMALASGCYRRRLTLLFSATWSSQTELLAVLLQGPIKVTVAGIPRVISQEVELIPKAARFRRLRDLLREFGDAKVLVFVLFKREARLVAKMLQGEGIQSWALEGNMSQAARSSAMQAFRDAKAGLGGSPAVLVATDVAARGLDVPDVSHVVNYSLGLSIDGYVHRIGRCGRAGRKGTAVTFVTDGDERWAGPLLKVLHEARQNIPPGLTEMAKDFSKGSSKVMLQKNKAGEAKLKSKGSQGNDSKVGR